MSSTLRIALAPGDGIGPEIMDGTLELFRRAGVMEHVEFVPVEMGAAVFARGDTRGMTDEAIKTTESCGLLFKGPMETSKGSGGKSINVTARKMWGAFANLRHVQTFPGVPTVYTKAGIHVNFYVVRENIEDTYGGIEHRLSRDVVQCKRLISAPACDQVHRFAFETARRIGLKRVHCGHKANIMKMTDGLFLDRFRAVAGEFPDIQTADMIIDALCMNMVMRPQLFEMVVLTNLQGDIVSDLAAGLIGGLGFAPSANIGDDISIFEAVHGTAPDIAGKGVANPTALILSGVMLLRHIGLLRQAATIENAVLRALESGVRTGDFGDTSLPALSTREFIKGIADRLGESPRTVAASPVPAGASPTLRLKERPKANRRLQTLAVEATRVAGCDIDIETELTAGQIAEKARAACEGTAFALTNISNRGTQVWPTGSVYTECVDSFRVRFETKPGAESEQGAAIALAERMGGAFTVGGFEVLRSFDGQRGYSLAQGQ